MQSPRGGCARCFENRGESTYRALVSACNPAPTTPTILNSGLRVQGSGFTPQTLQGGLSGSLLPFAVLHKNDDASLQTTAEKDGVGLWGPCSLCRRSLSLETENGPWQVWAGWQMEISSTGTAIVFFDKKDRPRTHVPGICRLAAKQQNSSFVASFY